MKYLIVVEPTDTGFSAFSPDLPGCVATGSDRAETERQMSQAIEFHLDGLRQDGLDVPNPKSYSSYVEVSA
ncbi:MAG: type II toxin-antitoxin system HicB family antitoxin [Gemmatimonadetes bacterium]|jgi:predicted RNase H-like HicB family nuclease|nr:type II toxin-antitoxin system HicB family antitoxin [Gemmatimonadota bacterium]MBT4612711.1 type II toxin-antitoxin system HicB family antitoxin [Gemmatimonadota bacterium]MBT5057257.1 type II toxin-antitoxin system HicB family antitoxin [Gemmatimonadota bacterium]MBT5145725.1 type II toxin-antitoxin system HicB family antitoxin [Gemmatimonadota bacterium]MBT5588045.1 type II toxin-antitoxin system HicB family antitoxin [Gemmatimonadota bacterium]